MFYLEYNQKSQCVRKASQITKFMGPTWGPPGSCRPQIGPHVGPMNLAIRGVEGDRCLWWLDHRHPKGGINVCTKGLHSQSNMPWGWFNIKMTSYYLISTVEYPIISHIKRTCITFDSHKKMKKRMLQKYITKLRSKVDSQDFNKYCYFRSELNVKCHQWHGSLGKYKHLKMVFNITSLWPGYLVVPISLTIF